jgi:DNA-binding transcriptional MerR regulator
MDTAERKQIIAQLLKEGRKLSEIQDYLRKEKGDSITYMELRMLLAEMEAKLPDTPTAHFEAIKAPSPLTAPAQPGQKAGKQPPATGAPPAAPGKRGRTSVAIDHAPPPGAMLSGQVRFGSGARAYWVLDDTGRIGLEPELGSGRPDQQDMQEFQQELRRILDQAQGGIA